MKKMDPEAVISTVVFGEDSMSRCWMLMVWALLQENGEVDLDSSADQMRACIAAVGIKKLLAQFYDCLSECGNDVGSMDLISVMDELHLGEECLWFVAGQDSADDDELEKLMDEQADIHEMAEYLIRSRARRIAALLIESFGEEVLFAQMLASSIEPDGGETLGFSSPEQYLEAVEGCYAQIEDLISDYGACYDWIEDGMRL